MKSPFYLLLFVIIALIAASCTPKTYTGTLVYKSFEPQHIETVRQTQIVRGTLHDNVPTDYAIPDRYLLFLELDSSAISPREFPVTKALYDSVIVGQKVTVTTGRKPRGKS